MNVEKTSSLEKNLKYFLRDVINKQKQNEEENSNPSYENSDVSNQIKVI
jgi:hypothetical protein